VKTSYLRQLLLLTALLPLHAGAGPSNDWSEPWSGKSTATSRALSMSQADLIEKHDSGYYDRVGTNIVIYEVHSSYAVGAINVTDVSVNVEGAGNVVDISNSASNTGAQDGSINESIGGDITSNRYLGGQ